MNKGVLSLYQFYRWFEDEIIMGRFTLEELTAKNSLCLIVSKPWNAYCDYLSENSANCAKWLRSSFRRSLSLEWNTHLKLKTHWYLSRVGIAFLGWGRCHLRDKVRRANCRVSSSVRAEEKKSFVISILSLCLDFTPRCWVAFIFSGERGGFKGSIQGDS